MKMSKKSIFGLAAVLTLSLAAIAYAHGGYGWGGGYGGYGGNMMGPGGYGYGHMMGPGYGYGHMMGPGYGGSMMGPGYGYGHMRGYGMDDGWNRGGCGNWRGLPDATVDKLEASQEQFYNDTRQLRDRIDEKENALQSELSQQNPDRDKIMALQKELSSLQGDFDQKALAHRLKVRDLLPEDYRADGYGGAYCW